MNILFICGCMEPGKDGVGDYTRRLAGELARSNQEILVLAIRDKYVQAKTLENQVVDGQSCNTIRLPEHTPVKKALELVRKDIEAFRPDWASLQFVPYAFDPKGLPFGLPQAFADLKTDVNWHIMFHETFVDGKKNFKNKVVRVGQILILRQLVSKLNPKIVHTSIPGYRDLLRKIGIRSALLGLFGNIGIKNQATADHSLSRSPLQGIYFGASPKHADFDKIAKKYARFITTGKKSIHLTFCGKANQDRRELIEYLKEVCDENLLTITDRGELTGAQLSELFQAADFGMARIGPALLGKSGAALAMLEHGLPLFVPLAEDFSAIRDAFDFRTDQCFHDLEDLEEARKNSSMGSRLPMIADQFLNELQAAPSQRSQIQPQDD